jgi:hypothetical protein
LINPAVGAALPDLVVFLGLGSPLPGQELVSIAMFADANGEMRRMSCALDIGRYPMNTSMVTFRAVMVAAVMLAAAVPGVASAGPAQPDKGTGCLVRDADLVQHVDPDCDYHEVFKYDSRGNSYTLLHYQDHGQLPPGAALPATAVQVILHVDCDCIYDGDYLETITPSGEYHSRGPLKTP